MFRPATPRSDIYSLGATLFELVTGRAPYGAAGSDALVACVQSPETQKKLNDDILYGKLYSIEGTPLVLLNGRKAVSFPPFLYAMVLTGGRTDHPAFQALPPPNPQAHLH